MKFNIYDLTSFTQWIDSSLRASMSPGWAVTVEMIIIGLAILIFFALIGLFLVYAERKVCALMQNRLGPNRVGPGGIFQTVADLVKLLFVELVPIKNADKISVQSCSIHSYSCIHYGYRSLALCQRASGHRP